MISNNRPKHTSIVLIVVALLVSISMACALSEGSGGIPTATLIPLNLPSTQPNLATAPSKKVDITPSVPPQVQISASPTASPTRKAALPEVIPLRQGLASLDTYILIVRTIRSGPTPNVFTDLKVTYRVNTPKKSSHTRQETTESTAEKPKPETDVTDSYQINTQSCSVSGDSQPPSGKLREVLPIEQDMTNTYSALMDINLAYDNPVFVAEETVNGIISNRYRFSITRLGKDSGGVVTRNQGEMWVAKDGKYLVKYTLVMEISNNSADKTQLKTMKTEVSMDLTGVNQPLDVVMPPYCVKK